MSITNSLLSKVALGAIVSAAAMAFSALPASAEVVCRHHECWHVKEHVVYPHRVGVIVRTDAWEKTHHRKGWMWRDDHDGRGYWMNGHWHTF